MGNLEKLLSAARDEKDITEKIALYKDISLEYWQRSELEKSKKYSILTLDLSRKYKLPHLEAAALNTLGLLHVSLNNYSKALNLFFQTLKVYESINQADAISLILNNIGLIFLKMKNLEKALEYFQKALEKIKDTEYRKGFNTEGINIHIGIVLMKMGELDQALGYFDTAESFSRKHKLHRSLGVALVNIGELLQKKGKYKESLAKFSEALDISQKLDDKRTIIPTLNNIGVSYREMNKPINALENHTTALKLAKEIDYTEFVINCYQLLSQDHEVMGNSDKALEYHKKYAQLKDDLYTNELSKRITEIHTSYENEKRDLETRRMLEEASKLASIGVMAAGITHEIGQPLNAIKISAESVLFWEKRNPGALAPEFLKEFNSISHAADRMAEIIQHMRSFWIAKEEDNGERISLNKTIRSGLSLVERQIFSHGINIRLNLCEDENEIQASQIELEQIIINLVVNSIHSLDEKNDPEKVIEIVTTKDAKSSNLFVKDSGIGISAGNEDRIFDPFFSTRSPGNGMGLGLAIVHKTIEKLKGSIAAENNEWGGATFLIRFPHEKEEV